MGKTPPTFRQLFERGKKHLKGHRFEKAAERLEAASRMKGADPARVEPFLGFAYRGLGERMMRAKDFKGAKVKLEKALKLGAADASLHFNLGMAHATLGNEADAVKHIDLALRGVPGGKLSVSEEVTARIKKGGVMLYNYKKPDEALTEFRALMEKIVNDKDYRPLMKYRPLMGELYHLVGTAHLDANRPQDAIRMFSEALKHDPEDVDTLALRGAAYGIIGSHNAAKNDFKAAHEKDPEDMAAIHGLASAHTHIGDAHEDGGMAARALGSHGLALQYARKGLNLEPNNIDFLVLHTSSAIALKRLGGKHASAFRSAHKRLDAAIKADPGEPHPRFLKAMLARASGNRDAARENLEAYFDAHAAKYGKRGGIYRPPMDVLRFLEEASGKEGAERAIERVRKKHGLL